MRSFLVRRKILRLTINPSPTFMLYDMLMINALLPCETQDFALVSQEKINIHL